MTFTMTNGSDGLREMQLLFDKAIEAEITEFGEALQTAPQGYHGHRSRHIFRGSRRDGHLFQVSSYPAEAIIEAVKQIGADPKSTRIDWQTTIRRSDGLPFKSSAARGSVKRFEARTGKDQAIATQTEESVAGGDSFTAGSRRSSRVLRIYDKSAQQSGRVGSGLVRIETQLRREQAAGSWQQFLSSDDQSQFSRKVNAAMLKMRGLQAPFEICGPDLKLSTTYNVSDKERRRIWLLETIAPMVREYESEAERRQFRIAFGL
jgi:hypothetical protein